MIRVEPAVLNVATQVGSLPPAAAGPLPVGSVFAVEAARDVASGQLLLLFAGRRWPLKAGGAADDVQPGTRLMARVVRGEPNVELAVLGRASEVAAALRRELPRQGSPLRLLANLEWLASRPDVMDRLPEPARRSLEAAWRSLAASEELATPEGLSRAVRDSGAQLEARLAAGTPSEVKQGVERDWKAVLTRLQAAVGRAAGTGIATRAETTPGPLPTASGTLHALAPESPTLAALDDPGVMLGELAQNARESLARVACNQLASLDGRDASGYPCVVEIPYRAQDKPGVLRLRIDRNARSTGGAGTVWSVDFAFDLGEHGPLRGRATLAEGRVSVTLQPEFGALAQALDARVEELRSTLEQGGVAVGKLTCTRSDPFDPGRTGAWLIDLRA